MKNDSERTKQRNKILLGFLASFLVILGIVLYFLNMGPIKNIEIINMMIVVFLVLGATYIFIDRAKNFRKGLPAEDEFMKRVNYKAGYYSFIAAIWISLIVMWMEDMLVGWGLEFRHGPMIVLLSTGIVFVLAYIYFSKIGGVE